MLATNSKINTNIYQLSTFWEYNTNNRKVLFFSFMSIIIKLNRLTVQTCTLNNLYLFVDHNPLTIYQILTSSKQI